MVALGAPALAALLQLARQLRAGLLGPPAGRAMAAALRRRAALCSASCSSVCSTSFCLRRYSTTWDASLTLPACAWHILRAARIGDTQPQTRISTEL